MFEKVAASSNDDFDDESEDESFDDDMLAMAEFAKRNKDYLTAPKHSERLRLCVKCVGHEREFNKLNVKKATEHCNKICKRTIFEIRK